MELTFKFPGARYKLVGDGRVGALTWQALRNNSNAAPLPGPF